MRALAVAVVVVALVATGTAAVARPTGERLVDPRRGWELIVSPDWERAPAEAAPPELVTLLRGPGGAVAVITRVEGPSPDDPAHVAVGLESRLAGAVPGYRHVSAKRIPYGRGDDRIIVYELVYRTKDSAVVARFMAYGSAVVGIAAATPGRSVGAAARRLVSTFRPTR